MEEFPSNSKADRQTRPTRTEYVKKTSVTTEQAPAEPEEKKVEKVTTGQVIVRKKGLGKRFSETFFAGAGQGVARYVVMEVLIPAAKDAIFDAFSQGLERTLFPDQAGGRRSGRRGGPSSTGWTNYNSMSSGARRPEPRELSRQARSQHNFQEIYLATRVEAEHVLDRLYDLVEKYEQATVADLYDLVGINVNDIAYTDNKWGWTDLAGSRIVRTRHGYTIDLPRPTNVS